jgi:hypothetical protein
MVSGSTAGAQPHTHTHTHSRARRAVEGLCLISVSAEDSKATTVVADATRLFASELSLSDIDPGGDIDVLITGVKFLLQNWDSCGGGGGQGQQGQRWGDLCFYLAGWLCAAVAAHGDAAALSKTIRNLQFVIAKGTKAVEQVGFIKQFISPILMPMSHIYPARYLHISNIVIC